MPSFHWYKFSAAALAVVVIACAGSPLYAANRKVQRKVQPIYPELAKRMRIGGTVHVEASVAADGTVTEAKTISGNKLLAPAAEDAIRRWKFAPDPAPTTETVDIDFELSD